MGTQHAQRVVVKRNTYREDNPQRVVTSNQWPVQTCTTAVKWNEIHVHVTMFVSVCTIISRQVYYMPHYAITMMYRSMCTTMQACAQVSQWEHMHFYVLCVNCKEITTRNHCN